MLSMHPLSRDSDRHTAELHALFMSVPTYCQLVEGRPPSFEDVDDFFDGKPDGTDRADKFTVGFYLDDELIGCADVIRGYPSANCAFIGLLLFAERHQGRGYGRQALGKIERMARAWRCSSLWLAVIETNPAGLAFWTREGFVERYRKTTERFTGDAIVMERCLIA